MASARAAWRQRHRVIAGEAAERLSIASHHGEVGTVAGHCGEAGSVAGDHGDDGGDGVFDFVFVSIFYFSVRAA
jgi:hypothetical protein